MTNHDKSLQIIKKYIFYNFESSSEKIAYLMSDFKMTVCSNNFEGKEFILAWGFLDLPVKTGKGRFINPQLRSAILLPNLFMCTFNLTSTLNSILFRFFCFLYHHLFYIFDFSWMFKCLDVNVYIWQDFVKC